MSAYFLSVNLKRQSDAPIFIACAQSYEDATQHEAPKLVDFLTLSSPTTIGHTMALEPLAQGQCPVHLRLPGEGKADEFIKLFEEFDYSPDNPMHKSAAQLKDGVLCRHREIEPLLFDRRMGERRGHKKIKVVAEMRPNSSAWSRAVRRASCRLMSTSS
jgi:hypothetical protein